MTSLGLRKVGESLDSEKYIWRLRTNTKKGGCILLLTIFFVNILITLDASGSCLDKVKEGNILHMEPN